MHGCPGTEGLAPTHYKNLSGHTGRVCPTDGPMGGRKWGEGAVVLELDPGMGAMDHGVARRVV